MDPKSPQLDPKLKEAYDRVMSMSIPKPEAKPAEQAVSQPTPVQAPPSAPAPEHQAQTSQPPQTSPTTPAEANPTPAPQASQYYTPAQSQPQAPASPAIQSYHLGEHTENHKEKKGMSPVVLILGVLIFFAVYAFFWLKVFKIF